MSRLVTSLMSSRFIKFCLVGASGVPVNLLVTWFTREIALGDLHERLRTAPSFVAGIVVSIFTNFILNDLWTWGDRRNEGRGFWQRLARFYFVCAAAAGIQFATAVGCSYGLNVHYLVAQCIGILVATLINFLANHHWTFRKG